MPSLPIIRLSLLSWQRCGEELYLSPKECATEEGVVLEPEDVHTIHPLNSSLFNFPLRFFS